MSCSKDEKFFIEDFRYLFGNDLTLFPSRNASYESKLNSLMRLCIIITIILLSFEVKYAWLFLLLALILIVVLYYLGKKKTCNEYFSESFFSKDTNKMELISIGSTEPVYQKIPTYKKQPIIGLPIPGRPIYTDKDGSYPGKKEEIKHRIFGSEFSKYEQGNPGCIIPIDSGINPRQLIPPVIPTPLSDTEVWNTRSSLPGNHNNGEFLEPFMMEDSYIPKHKEVLGMDNNTSGTCVPKWLYDGQSRYTLQSMQPNMYVDYRDEQPINATNGISFAYTRPPLFKTQTEDKDVTLYTRIDPQLIRDDVNDARAEELPDRDQHSAKYSYWEAKRGTYDPDEINNIQRYDEVNNRYDEVTKDKREAIKKHIKEGYNDLFAQKYVDDMASRGRIPINGMTHVSIDDYNKVKDEMEHEGYIEGQIIGTDYIKGIKEQIPAGPTKIQARLIGELNARTGYETQEELDAIRGDIPAPISQADVRDTRFTSYGDPMRAYYNIEEGDIQYYYGDVDAYREPVFTTRTKVDHIDFTDPMGRVKPRYVRENCTENKWACEAKKLPNQNVEYDLGLDNIREQVEDAFTRDSLFYRESLMESQMGRDNARRWQFRYRPQKSLGAGYSYTR